MCTCMHGCVDYFVCACLINEKRMCVCACAYVKGMGGLEWAGRIGGLREKRAGEKQTLNEGAGRLWGAEQRE